jgi:hypothetical protein
VPNSLLCSPCLAQVVTAVDAFGYTQSTSIQEGLDEAFTRRLPNPEVEEKPSGVGGITMAAIHEEVSRRADTGIGLIPQVCPPNQ